MYELQHPQITNALLCGYPQRQKKAPLCPHCGGELGDYSYEISPGEFICEDCFRDSMEDYARTNPRELAQAMDIRTVYLG